MRFQPLAVAIRVRASQAGNMPAAHFCSNISVGMHCATVECRGASGRSRGGERREALVLENLPVALGVDELLCFCTIYSVSCPALLCRPFLCPADLCFARTVSLYLIQHCCCRLRHVSNIRFLADLLLVSPLPANLQETPRRYFKTPSGVKFEGRRGEDDRRGGRERMV